MAVSYQSQMNAMLTAFGVDPVKFHEMLTATGAFIAGGAATHILTGGDPASYDGDIDIWYPNAPPREGDCSEERIRAFRAAEALIDAEFSQLGYFGMSFRDGISHEYTDKANSLNTQIRKVQSFFQSGKVLPRMNAASPVPSEPRARFQVIYAVGNRYEVLRNFDYSFCAVGYDPATGELFGPELELTKAKQGYAMLPARNPERDAVRRAKYATRGFTVIDKPAVPGRMTTVAGLREMIANLEVARERDTTSQEIATKLDVQIEGLYERLDALEKANGVTLSPSEKELKAAGLRKKIAKLEELLEDDTISEEVGMNTMIALDGLEERLANLESS